MGVIVRLFGGARLEGSDEGVVRGRAAHRRRLALLSILGASPTGGMTRDRLVALLWPEDGADKGRRQLTEAIYVIRKELGDAAIETAGETVALNHDLVRCDVAEFRRAVATGSFEEAAALYTAPFLDGWYVDNAPEFERWSSEIREDLAKALRGILGELSQKREAAGNWAEAAGWLSRLAREDPYSSQVAIRLAKALDASGERAAALRALATHEARLREDLDLAPSEEVVRLAESLKSTKPRRSESRPVADTPVRIGDDIEAAPEQTHRTPSSRASAPTAKSSRRVFGLIAAAAAVLIAALALRRNAADTGSLPNEATAAKLDASHVAVLYFDDHSEGRVLGHIAEGLTEELIHQLAEVSALRVVSRNGVKRFREFPATPDSIAAMLRAGSVVEGSVQRSRDSLRVTVQLIDGNTGLHLESRTFQRPMAELFEMERDIAASVATALRQRLGASFVVGHLSRGTRSVEALELMLRARRLRDDAQRIAMHPHENDSRSARRLLTTADSLLHLAEQADPRWTRPTLERGWIQLQQRRLLTGAERRGSTALAEQLANAVLSREARNGEALQLRGTARWRSVSGAMRESADSARAQTAEADLRAALAIDSTLATGWATLADILNVRGASAEAELATARALRQDAWLDGADETFFRAFASSLMLQRYGDAARWCQEGQRVYPESWRFYECELTLMREDRSIPPNAQRAWLLVALMDSLDPPDRARTTGHAYSPFYRRAVAAAVSARAGDRVRATTEIASLRSSASRDSVLALDLLFEEAAVRYETGEVAEARRLVELLFAARPMLRTQLARVPLVRSLSVSDRQP